MLRLFALLLLLANGVYFAWSQGLLQAYGFAPQAQSEPQRLAQQLLPERLRLLTAAQAKMLETAAPAQPTALAAAPTRLAECLQAGLFDDAQAANLRRALEARLPSGTWSLDAAVEPPRWIVYMGKYPSADALAKKRSELASLNLKFETLANPALAFGLSLGGFDTQAAADAGLVTLSRRGVRTARVLLEHGELRGISLKIPAASDDIKARFDGLKLALAGKPFRTCQ